MKPKRKRNEEKSEANKKLKENSNVEETALFPIYQLTGFTFQASELLSESLNNELQISQPPLIQTGNIYRFFPVNTFNNNVDVNSLDLKIDSKDAKGIVDILRTFDQADLDRELFDATLSKRNVILVYKMFHNTKANLKQKVENSLSLLKCISRDDVEAARFFKKHEMDYKKLSPELSANDIGNHLQLVIDTANNAFSTQLFLVQLLLELVKSVPEYNHQLTMSPPTL